MWAIASVVQSNSGPAKITIPKLVGRRVQPNHNGWVLQTMAAHDERKG